MIKKFKNFNESSEELSLEKKFEYAEDLFVAIEDLGFEIKYRIGILKWNDPEISFIECPIKAIHLIKKLQSHIGSDNEDTPGIMVEVIDINANNYTTIDRDRRGMNIKMESNLSKIYDRLLISKIILSKLAIRDNRRFLYFSIE